MIQNIKENKKYYIILFAIFFVNLFLRLYKLGSIPYAMHVDEAGLWYNVKSLLAYGCDQGGNTWPLLFANYWGEQSAMYTYLALICVKLFGDTLFAIRLPAVLNACLVFIFGNKIVSHVYKNNKVNIVFSVLISLCPYFILSQRMALDCNLMLGFSTMFLWFFIKAIKTQKTSDAIIAGISCGAILYTYVLSYVALPIFLITLFIILTVMKKISWKQAVAFATPLFILAVPLIAIQVINILDLQEIKLGLITLTKFDYSRHNDMNNVFSITVFLKPFLFMFMPSHSHTLSLELVQFGNLQWITLPFFFIGLISNMKNLFVKDVNVSKKMLSIFWLSIYITSLFANEFTWQINSLMCISVLFIIDGVIWLINKIKDDKVKKASCVLLAVIFLVLSFMFVGYHWTKYAEDEAASYSYISNEKIQAALNFVEEINTENKEVHIINKSILYRVYNDINYDDPMSTYHDKFEDVINIDGYYFDEKLSTIDSQSKNRIYIIHTDETKIELLRQLDFIEVEIGPYVVFYN